LLRGWTSCILRSTFARFAIWFWGLAAAVALLWPSRIAGPFEGVPLDGAAEAVGIGVAFPVLLWMHPRFLATRFARACVIALLAWKMLLAVVFVQDGLCVRMTPSKPYVRNATGAPHSWDLRADWRSPDPACSAIMTRPYEEFSDFPAWFFNLPAADDSWPGPYDRPPGATTGMTVTGYIHAPRAGVLRIAAGADVAATISVAGRSVSGEQLGHEGIALDAGVEQILVDAMLTGDRWRLLPTWNGADLFARPMATVQRPSAFQIAVRPWVGWVSGALVIALSVTWLGSFILRIGNADLLAWAIGASSCIGFLAATGDGTFGQWAVIGLAAAALLRVPARVRNITGAFALIGIPWLTLVVVEFAPQIGHFTLYTAGDDFWTFQRYAYRIVMQGYWLEGGSVTFWFQPLYRWIAGALHLIFGDSSIGERYWDGTCVLLMAMFSFHVTKVFGGFRLGIVAAVMTLAVFTLGTTWVQLGRGLSEISSAGLMALAALVALRSRHRAWRPAIAAGLLGTLAFYTRLNNLPMAFALVVWGLPVRQPVRTIFRPATLVARTSWPTVAGVTLMLGLGLLAFAWRTWYYTGVFSVFYGTQREFLAVWQPGMSPGTVLGRMIDSVLMVLTMNDPVRFDPYALPLLLGAGTAVLAAMGVPRVRNLPLGLVVTCLAGLAGALVSRGSAYPGRFSIHMIAVTCTIVMCTAAAVRGRSLRVDVR
jgi:hypothetical protein